MILQSLARRWTEFEGTKDEAMSCIEDHNKHFNADGDFMEDDERTDAFKTMLEHAIMMHIFKLIII